MDEQNVVTTTTTTDENPNTVEPTTTTATTEPKKDEKPANAEVEKLKAALSKANGEAAEYKRQLRLKQTEQERAEAERAEAEQAMREELETLRKEKAVADFTNRALALDFNEEVAGRFANALASGDTEAMFDALKAFVDATTIKANNAALNRQPGLSAGTPPSTNTVDAEAAQIRKWMGLK